MRNDLLVCPHADETLWDSAPDIMAPTHYGIEVYTAGDCWALAWHLSEQLKAAGFAGDLFVLGWPHWEHVVVRIGRNQYLDATGVHSRADIRSKWFGNRLVSIGYPTLDAYETALDTDFVYPSGHAEAAEFARRLIAKHVHHHDAQEETAA
jgi:hypothetical protein